MKVMRYIRRMWVTSNVLIAGGVLLLATPLAEMWLWLLGLGVLLAGIAWVAAFCNAVACGQMGWAGFLLCFPIAAFAMWAYVLGHFVDAPEKPPPPPPYSTEPSYSTWSTYPTYPTYPPYPPWPPYSPYSDYSFREFNDPLVLRQAIEVVEEAERRYGDWWWGAD